MVLIHLMVKKNQDFRLVDTKFQQLKREGSGQRNWYLGKTPPSWFSIITLAFPSQYNGKKKGGGNFWDCFASRSVRSAAHGIPSWSQEALAAIVGGSQGWFPLSFLQMGKSNFKSYSKVAEK